MDFEGGNIDEYYSSDDVETEYSDSESEGSVKNPALVIGGALSDDEEKDEDDEESESDSESESEEKEVLPKTNKLIASDGEDEDEDEDEEDEHYLQKFDREINNNYILHMHPECKIHNYDEISCLTKVVYNSDGIIVDPLHRTIPILTKYERARILGQRAKQINAGSLPFVKVPENIIDGYLIAELELAQKRIPFIIRRPFPGGGSEYWNLKDLELIEY